VDIDATSRNVLISNLCHFWDEMWQGFADPQKASDIQDFGSELNEDFFARCQGGNNCPAEKGLRFGAAR
jgi:hypothetical protein